jgi:hypothetical protein
MEEQTSDVEAEFLLVSRDSSVEERPFRAALLGPLERALAPVDRERLNGRENQPTITGENSLLRTPENKESSEVM